MIRFKVAESGTGKSMVEVWRDDIFIAGIYEHEEGVRLISKYYDGVKSKPGVPTSVLIKLKGER